ncbi:hypothetical protein [Mycolicibacterium sarraceniae]|uniref:Uncharacterized protein n=1 Tax=Mycolicibacterium sarraceniae TaxID=1534348 RepID=A0A7I7SVC3_9MYCO|nr:hypothetical protein [Mycolicibacterium sarraceniae]BBY60748.1 hypothetical protein MSAR_38840 [Mycolicibacterium sarraceniae]
MFRISHRIVDGYGTERVLAAVQPAVFVIRPDGYLRFTARDTPDRSDLKAALTLTFS